MNYSNIYISIIHNDNPIVITLIFRLYYYNWNKKRACIKIGFCGNLNLELLFFRDVKKEVGSEFLDKKRDLKTLFILFRLNGWKTASNCSWSHIYKYSVKFNFNASKFNAYLKLKLIKNKTFFTWVMLIPFNSTRLKTMHLAS